MTVRPFALVLFLMALGLCARAADRYVWPDAPSSGAPYESWASAATNMQDAVDAAAGGETVWVTNGTYGLLSPVLVDQGVTVQSVNGKDVTAVTRGTTAEIRIFVLSNANAVVDGFTISNGIGRAEADIVDASEHSYGGGVRMHNGTVRNCRIVANTSRAGVEGATPHGPYGYGGGIHMAAGRVENCDVLDNEARGSGGSSSGAGGGIDNTGGEIVNCTIRGNSCVPTGNGRTYGGGVRLTGAGSLLDSMVSGSLVQPANNVHDSYGGGVYINGSGVVSNCVIAGNTNYKWQTYGGGVYLAAGLVTDSLIVSNRSQSIVQYSTLSIAGGGGVYVAGGTLRNSVVADNRATHLMVMDGNTRGAGVFVAAGTVQNCTISGNRGEASGRGDGLYVTAGDAWNCIVYHNYDSASVNGVADHENVYQSGGTINYSCTTNSRGLTGVGNVAGDPGFADRTVNDFHLLPGSPCIDTGSNMVAVVGDRDGRARPRDGDGDAQADHDMGAYEAVPLDQGALRVGFTAEPAVSTGSASVVFAAYVGGTNTNGLVYVWDYTNDGTPDESGADKASVTHLYADPGYYTVKLVVSNALGQSATLVRPAGVRVFPAVVYVATGGSHTFPFDTWAKAATVVQDAVDAALPGIAVLVSNGAYAVSTPVIVRRGVTLSSVNGAEVTGIERSGAANTRIFLVTHPDAVVERLTIRNGSWVNSGMAFGGGLWLTDGMVRDCVISNNLVQGLPNQPGAGGGVYMEGGKLRSCLLCRNASRSSNSTGHGAGVYMSGGTVENCTVVSNLCAGRLSYAADSDASRGGGIYRTAGTVTNTVVFANALRNPTIATAIDISGMAGFGFSCSPDLSHDPAGTGNITNAPSFEDVALGDFRLAAASSCIDAGTNLGWMASATDLDGADRITRGVVDMGAYEAPDPTAGPLTCDFSAPVTEGFAPFHAVFTATFTGPDTNIVWYGWDFNGDGSNDLSGADLRVVTNTYDVGVYDVALAVSNALAVTTQCLHAAYLTVNEAISYVATNGGHVSPFDTWAKAAQDIQSAVDVALDGQTIMVSNGVYAITSQVEVAVGATVRSVHGEDVTVVHRSGVDEHRIFFLNHAGVVLDGFTISNGIGRAEADIVDANEHSYGGGVRMNNGTVRNCRIVANTSRAGVAGATPHGPYGYGGGIYMAAGRVENCDVLDNEARGSGGSSSGAGGGIDNTGGEIVDCTISGNSCVPTGNGRTYGGGVRLTGAGRLQGSLVSASLVQPANNAYDSYGGGVYINGSGMVSNCVIACNTNYKWQSYGGGVYLAAGLVTDSLIVSNRSQSIVQYSSQSIAGGAGAYVAGGTLRNSVVVDNRATHVTVKDGNTRGAGVLVAGGTVQNCTISRNVGAAYGRGDGLYVTAGDVWNCIVTHNYDGTSTNGVANHENVYQSGGTVNHSCTTNSTPLTGVGNVSGEPGFADRSANDYHLLPGSLCIDSGSNLAAVVGDRDGNARPRDGDGDGLADCDMGAYEAAPLDEGPLRAGFTAAPATGLDLVNVAFAAYVAGTNTNGLVYVWDYTNDGTPDESGGDKASVTHLYAAPGYYTVKLTVENAVAQSATVVEPEAVRVFPSVVYASTAGSDTFPFDTWAKAATDLQDAVDAARAGTTVLLADGVCGVSTPVIVRRGVTVSSANGAAATAVERAGAANTRIFLLCHPNAVLERLTIRNGSWVNSGMAFGGGVWMTAGMVRDCVISNNLAQGLPNQPGAGGGVYMEGGTLRNCLLRKNESRASNQTGHGGGVYMSGGLVESCTVVTNLAAGRVSYAADSDASRGGGVYGTGGAVTNTIVVGNAIRNPTVPTETEISGTADFGYSCSPDLTHDPAGTGNINTAPLFVDAQGGDYRLDALSPCVNAGLDRLWMAGALDVGGALRRSQGVDMGAYEYGFPMGTLFLVR